MRIFAVIGLLLWAVTASAAEPALDLTIGGESRHFTRDQLLARPDAKTIEVAKDAIYGRTMTYRAVPLAALIAGLTPPPDTVVEAIATDGYAAQLPVDQILSTDPKTVIAWVAIEPADAPWPKLPEKTVSAGTFYLVWTGDQAATVRSEQWPYQMAKLDTQPSPAARWPELAVDPALPAADPIRSGQTLFVTQCLVCHKFSGAGSADVGPDLNRPMNPTQYLTAAALHALIRDPASVRDWPDRKMQGFTPEQMSDREIDQVIAYLKHMAGRKG
ncbi:c-type cytochrome [Inquilinus limosus]|uniref:Cytochrome C n=1 Tax=Inquilinus limosus MP06 TaxID=1398085 RepID=A0A0A0CYR0_9PROT|nr:c-type cytochrome [Inquilinus limosus]KGM30854.1 cytochrome C [Inquilinus limosus MP06]